MTQYTEILKDILMNESWLKKKKILQEFKNLGIEINERNLRSIITKFNKNYGVTSDFYIAHSSLGYKLTTKKEDIYQSIQDQRKRALNMLKQYYSALDAIGLQNQLSLDIQEDQDEIFDVVVKGFEGYGK